MLTWNVHGLPFDDSVPPRMDAIGRELRARRPDLVLLQEAWLDVEAARLGCTLAADYDRVPDAEGVRSGFLGLFGRRSGGLMAFVRRASPWRLEGAPQFVSYAQAAPWYRLGEMDGIAAKGVQRFALSDGARRVVVLNTHLQAQYPQRGHPYREVRGAQVEELLARSREALPAGAVLVAGDFNVREEEGALYGALTRELEDLTAAYRRACGCATLVGRGGEEAWWIDYVMARREAPVRVARVERVRNRGRDDPWSDHHGVWVELDVR